MKRALALLIVAALSGCQSKPRPDGVELRVTAAERLTRGYAQSRLSAWNVRAAAAGTNCDVLLVQTSAILDDSMVEALHYGAGAYAVFSGGVHRFSSEQSFRGVAYEDGAGRLWTFDDVTAAEAKALRRCD